jgi:glutathione synthase/RimK-type ligase-like ATP-grasp enzyme
MPEKGEPKYQEPIELDPENTLIMPRGLGTLGFTSSRYWCDMIMDLELDGFTTVPSIKCWDNCSSKYLTDVLCRKAGLRTPKTVAIAHSEDTERAVKELGGKFPIILKSSTGTQTGVGVVIIESMRSLNAVVQMILLYNKYLPVIIQEYIPLEYDIRIMLLDDICNSGDSMRRAYDILQMYDLPVLPFAFSLVNKVNKGVHDDNFDKDFLMPPEVKLLHLYSLDDFNLTGSLKLH